MAFCKGCGRPLVRAMSSDGKTTLCDAEPVTIYLKLCTLEEPTPAHCFIPHWITCPASEKTKKVRERE